MVEDSFDLQEIVQRVLRNAGFEVVTATTNSEAMTVLEKFAPDMVLTDCFLAGAGPLMVSVLKESRPKLPIIVLSSDPERARMLLPDADAVLAKPISLAELTHTVLHYMSGVETERLGEGPDS